MENHIWICSSLFIEQSQWHLALENGVKKFIDSELSLGVKATRLSFNNLSGNNIQLAFFTEADDAPNFVRRLDLFFKDYLTDNLPSAKRPAGPGIFMKMPYNTIKYGLYPPPKVSTERYGAMVSAISQVMIEFLSEEEVDHNGLITVGMYLHLALLEQYFKVFATEIPLGILHNKGSESDTSKYFKDLLECQPVLLEIFDLLHYSKELIHPSILNWSALCGEAFRANDPNYQHTGAREFRLLINDQLGFNKDTVDMIDYFIIKIYSLQSS